MRRCDGEDPFLTVLVDRRTREPRAEHGPDQVCLPCACGLVFDDDQRSTVWPHERVTRGEA